MMAMMVECMAGATSVAVGATAPFLCRTRMPSFAFPDAFLARIPSVGRGRGSWSTVSCGLSPHSLRVIAKGLVRAQSQAASDDAAVASVPTTFKHLLLPIMDKNPYLSAATQQAAATTTSLANMYGADITVVVIDEDQSETTEDHEVRMKNIRWHLAEGGFKEFRLVERLGEGKRPAAVIGEVADDMGLDLVVLSMESIHLKHIDSNLLAEFVPCPVLLLPL
ncbi:hypothetical protein CY35_09G020100 [Sphagnum magellanicum]|nr:hypothetical protein CY35_09G020100 [Sphagnum magellanicum]KAH9551532.1 hypothetical protein CY35_09G020100 [Sphagnum magellanicum]